jgi:PAS domain S-box-containing protein
MSSHDTTSIEREERTFQSCFETAPDAMVIANEAGKIIFVNAQTERMFGYRRGELLDQKVEMSLPVRFWGKHRSHRSRFFRDPKIRSMAAGIELYALRKDGTEFPVEISLGPLQTDEGVLISSAIRDISGRKQAAEALRRSEEKLRLLVTGVKDYAILMLDVECRVTTSDDGAERIKGYRAEEIIGEYFSKFYAPEALAEDKPALELRIATAGSHEHRETRDDDDRPRGSETILLAEDHDGLRETAREMLEALGYRVLVASDGGNALKLFTSNAKQIDLVVMDVVMPVLSGPEAYVEMSALKPGVRVIFTTGYTPKAKAVTSMLEKGGVILQKTVQPYEP